MNVMTIILTHLPLNINKRPLRHYRSIFIWLRLLTDTLVDSRRLDWAGFGRAMMRWAGLGWAGLCSYGINMRHEYFLNKPIKRKRDFGEQ